jgi:hypothetical protein
MSDKKKSHDRALKLWQHQADHEKGQHWWGPDNSCLICGVRGTGR